MTPSVAHLRPEYFLPVVIAPAFFFFFELAMHLQRKDRFLARLFAEHRDLWDALGGPRPRTWRWSPPRETPAPAPANSPTIYFDWFSAAEPAWLLGAPELRADYQVLRAGVRRWNFVAMPVLAGAALLFFLLVSLTQ